MSHCSDEIITNIKDIVLILTSITGATIAILGLSTWKKQLKGKVEYELAKKILKLLFQYRDSLSQVRHPAMWVSEMPAPPEEEAKEMNSKEKKFYGRQEAYKARWEKIRSVRAELYPEILEAEVLWDDKLKKLLDPLFELEMKLLFAIQDQLEVENPEVSQEDKEHLISPEQNKERRTLMYARFSGEDKFQKDVTKGIEEISVFLKQHLHK